MNEMENTDREIVEEIVDEKLAELAQEQRSTTVSRRGTLGLAGLVGLGALGAGSRPVAAVEDHELEQDLDCNEHDLENVNNFWASHTYASFCTTGDGNGNLQLYDTESGLPFMRASEDADRSGPGPVKFQAPIMGIPEEEAGAVDPVPVQIIDDVELTGHDLQEVGAIDGDVTDGQRVESLAGDNITISNGQLSAETGEIGDDLESRLDDAVTRLEVVSGTGSQWRVGPSAPVGDPHRNGSFGTLFEIEEPTYFGECLIETDTSGQFTAALYAYDPDTDELEEQIDTNTIQATGEKQTVFLDFLAEDPGQYLLTRLIPEEEGEGGGGSDSLETGPEHLYRPEDDTIELYRTTEYDADDFEDDSQNGVTVLGSHNPYFTNWDEPQESNYYYYFDLEVSTVEDA